MAWDDGTEGRMCLAKKSYASKKDALTAINHAMKNRDRHGRPNGLAAYDCPFCANWHIAKRNDYTERKR